MRIQNSKSWVRYSLGNSVLGAVAILLGAFMVRYALQPLIEPYAPFHFFIIACLLIAYLFGYVLALVGVFVSSFLGIYFFVKPYFSLSAAETTDVIQFVNFAAVSVSAIFIIEQLRRSAYAKDVLLKVMESRHSIALYRENDRVYFSKKNNEASAILERVLISFEDVVLLQFGEGYVKLEPLFFELTHCEKTALAQGEWQSYIHPDDLPVLIDSLMNPLVKSTEEINLTCRFLTGQDFASCQVQLEVFQFMGKALKILRLKNSDAH
jgi:K+-sensing histidine kinase KdpD